jgi:hypothetical protein
VVVAAAAAVRSIHCLYCFSPALQLCVDSDRAASNRLALDIDDQQRTAHALVYKLDSEASRLRFSVNVPEIERAGAIHLDGICGLLDSYVNNFRAALLLFNGTFNPKYENDTKLFVAWKFLAARDGVITIYNFSECLLAIKESARKLPTINSKVDWSMMRKATREFRAKFPSFDALRHGVAHAAELASTQKSFNENAITTAYEGQGFKKGAGGTLFVTNHLTNNVYSTVHQGFMRSYPVTVETLSAIESIRDQIVAALKNAAGNFS